MNIAHFIYDHIRNPWLGGGGARRSHEINKRLVAAGHRVYVICGGFPRAEDCVEDGIHYFFCGHRARYSTSRIQYSLQCRSIFVPLCSKYSVDIVVDDTSAFSISMPWRVWNGPRIGIVHHVVGHHMMQKFMLLGHFFRWWEKFNLRHYKFLTVVSKGTESDVKALSPKSLCRLVANGIDDLAFAPSHEKRDSKILLYLGRIEIFNKGLDDLLKSFELACNAGSTLELHIAGGGKDEELLKKQIDELSIRNRIHWHGRVSEEEKYSLLHRAAFLCMPSRYEGWGIVAIEAAACGCPVLARDIPGLSEAVLDQQTGTLFAATDVHWHRLLLDPAWWDHFADQSALIEFAQRFTWESATEAFFNFLEEVKDEA